MKTYTYEELNTMRVTKGELFLGESDFDFALPQTWLDDFAAWCSVHAPEVTYHLILSTTVWSYKDSFFGKPLTRCIEVQTAIYDYNAAQ